MVITCDFERREMMDILLLLRWSQIATTLKYTLNKIMNKSNCKKRFSAIFHSISPTEFPTFAAYEKA